MKQSEFNIVNQITVAPETALVLVGTALDGPSNIPFSLADGVVAHDALGQSPLADAYVAARRMGVSTIIAYRLNGMHSTGQLKDKNGLTVMEFRSICAGDTYNNIQVLVYSTHLYVVNTDGTARSYFFDKYPKAVDLAYAINRDAFYGLLEFNAVALDEYYSLSNMVDNTTEVIFKNGSSEAHLVSSRDPLSSSQTMDTAIIPILKERLKVALFGESLDDIADRYPNSNLGVLNCGVITICDMYHDDDVEFTEILGSFCLNKTKEIGFGCIGVIGTKPIYSNDNVQTRVLDLVSLSESLEDLEAYKYVQVIVGHTQYPESKESSISLAYGYAATQAQLPYHIMMSNKAIRGVGKLNFALHKEDVALLTANGYTCIVPSIRRGFVPYYASSFSKDRNSLVSKPHNLRISQYVSYMLTEEVDSFVGESYAKLSIKEAIDKAKEVLSTLVENKVIKSYNINYELLENNTVLNINALLTPLSELKSINTIAIISFPQGGVA